jgi:hypothetical protein
MTVHYLSDKSLGGRAPTRLLAAPMGLGAQLAGGAVAAQHLLNKRETDAKHAGKGTLGAQPPLVCGHNLLPEIDRIGCHMLKAIAVTPDDQVQTALGLKDGDFLIVTSSRTGLQ